MIEVLSLHLLPGLILGGDNLTDDDFQEFPGTPPMGRQISPGIGLDW